MPPMPKSLPALRASAATLAMLLAGCGNSAPVTGGSGSVPPSALPPADSALSSYIVPLMGTFPPGFVNPGPFVPFGMVHPGPDTEGPLNYGGYSFQNALITGFSHIHMSAGVPKGGQIVLMPVAGDVLAGDLADLGYPGAAPAYASPFTHLGESAEAAYYSVDLLRYGIKAELTATERAGLHRYTYAQPGSVPRVIVALSRDLAGRHPATAILRGDGTLTGSVHTDDVGGYAVYFAAKFSASYTAQVLGGAALTPDQEVAGDDLSLVLSFAPFSGPLLAKVGISFVDADGALRNLDAEIPGLDFDAVRAQARAKLDEALARITLEGGTLAERQSFYTALARAQQFPNLLSDADGRYPGPDDRIHQDARPHYSQFSLWDSYRGQNQLLAEIAPDVYRDMVLSLLDFHRQAGRLPRWQQAQRDAAHMSGDPATSFIVEAICRGIVGGSETAELLDAMRALAAGRDPGIELGYAPVAKPTSIFEQLQGGPREAGTTLEYGIADFALALAAGDDAIAQRSRNYRNLLDGESGFIRPRHDDGSWLTPFLPELGYGFQEGTSWQYSWLAMHDYAGLIAGMGGADVVRQKLDLFFGYPLDALPLVVPTLQNALTVFGTTYYGNQYAPGNEHDLQAPYVYHYLGLPWRSALTSRAAASLYTPTPLGLPGNDDLGALSGWLVWTMLGAYPINPGAPLYLIASPHFTKATLHRPGGDFTINAPGASALNRFVTAATLDGIEASGWFVMPRRAGALDMTTSALPDPEWGAESLPPSSSTHRLEDFGCTR